jgi:hypothetical protein
MVMFMEELKAKFDMSPFMYTLELPNCSLTDIQYFFCKNKKSPRQIDICKL